MKQAKKVLMFFPHNPWPYTEGSEKRFGQLLAAFREIGAEVYLLSTDFFGRTWNTESVESLRALGVHGVFVYKLNVIDGKYYRYFREKRRKMDAPNCDSRHLNPPLMRLWFLAKALLIRPDAIVVHYAYWRTLLQFTGPLKTIKAVDMLDYLTLNDHMRRQLRPYFNKTVIAAGDISEIPDTFFEETFWEEQRSVEYQPELSSYDHFDYTLAISRQEAELVRSCTSRTRVIEAFYIEPPVFIDNKYGSYALFPAGQHVFNRHAYIYFLKKIWPRIKAGNPAFELSVTGGMKKCVIETDGIRLLEFVPDMKELYRECRFVVCPVLAGTGQSIKVAEAMSYGLPVVTTRYGAAGSPLVHGENGFIAQNAGEFADYCLRLWDDVMLCRRMGENARRAVSGAYADSTLPAQLEAMVSGK